MAEPEQEKPTYSGDLAKLDISQMRMSTGDPRDLRTDPTVPKAIESIQVALAAGKITNTDRKLFNFLLAVAYPDLRNPAKSKFSVDIGDIRAFMAGVDEDGEIGSGSSHESNDRIKASCKRLGSVVVDFDYLSDKGKKRTINGGLIVTDTPEGEGVVYFEFPSLIKPFLAEPALFARLRLATVAQLEGKYSVIFYEHIELHANKRVPEWRISIEDFRRYIGVGDKMGNFKDLRKYVIEPSVQEINDKSGVTVMCTELTKGRKVVELVFGIAKKDVREQFEAELRHKAVLRKMRRGPRVVRDLQTPDMLDGKTYLERGGPAMLKAGTIDTARARHPGWDIDNMEREWRDWQVGREPPRDPDAAFLAWLGRRLANRSLLD
jgi:hypothetical protein